MKLTIKLFVIVIAAYIVLAPSDLHAQLTTYPYSSNESSLQPTSRPFYSYALHAWHTDSDREPLVFRNDFSFDSLNTAVIRWTNISGKPNYWDIAVGS